MQSGPEQFWSRRGQRGPHPACQERQLPRALPLGDYVCAVRLSPGRDRIVFAMYTLDSIALRIGRWPQAGSIRTAAGRPVRRSALPAPSGLSPLGEWARSASSLEVRFWEAN